MLPLLSVCLITYKHESYIRQAIESVLMQKVNFNWEFIIADDCSPDQTRQIVSEYKYKYPGLIRLIFREKNVGPAQNFMELLAAAKGKYIAYIEGDDYWTDEFKLQKQVDILEQNSSLSIAAHGAYELTDKLSLLDGPFNSDTVWSTKDILSNNWFIMSGSLMIRRTMLDISPAWYPGVSHGDLALILLTSLNGDGFFSPEPMSVYRITNTGVMSGFTIKDSKSYIFLLNQFNKTSQYKFDKEIRALKEKIRIDILQKFLNQNKTTNPFSGEYLRNLIEIAKWAKAKEWPYVAKRSVMDKLQK